MTPATAAPERAHVRPQGPPAREPGGLDRLFARLTPVLPELRYAQPGGDDPALVAEFAASALAVMQDYWRRAHPEAGRHYVSMRCWGLAVWQPVYLCVLAAHLHTHVPRLDGLRQLWSPRDGLTHGVWLPAHALQAGPLEQRLARAAGEIKRLATWMRIPAGRILGLKDRALDAVLAECTLAALLLAAREGQGDAAWTHRWAAVWLRETGLDGACGLRHSAAGGAGHALMLDRTVCCHHFRRHDGEKCASCPKLPTGERMHTAAAPPQIQEGSG